MISLGSRLIACCKLAPTLTRKMWRHNYVTGRNEYLIFTLSESINPWVYLVQFLFKSTNNSWRYERKCEWVFFLNTVYKERHKDEAKITLICRGKNNICGAYFLSNKTRRHLTLCHPLLPYGFSYKASCARPSFVIFDIQAIWRSGLRVRVPRCQKLQMMA